MSLNVNRETFAPLTDLASAVASTITTAADRMAREVAGLVADGTIDSPATSPEAQATQEFEAQFGQLAQDKDEFHALMKQVYGNDYDAATAEQYRQMALRGDYSFLPPVQFVSRETLNGANGAYSEADGVIYLAEDLKNDPARMQAVYIEEAGHHLDTRLNTTDTAGDEGELFRRLLSGEKLSASQITAIRAENDKGVIYVDGKKVEVEYWFGEDLWNAATEVVSDVVDYVGDAVGNAVDAVGDAVSEVVDGVVDTVTMFVGGFVDGIGGFFSNIVQFRVADAFQSLIDGADKAFLQAPKRLANAAINAAERIIHAPTYLLPEPVGGAVRDFQSRGIDSGRTLFNTAADVTRNIIRTTVEVPIHFGEDLWNAGVKLSQGDFMGALGGLGWALAHPFVSGAGLVVDTVMMGAQATVNVFGNLTYLHEPSRPLTDDEKEYLRSLYGDSIDVDSIRVHTDNLSTKMGIAPHTIGNDIYIPRSVDATDTNGNPVTITFVNPDGTLTDEGKVLLAHEAFHSWQHQNGGSDYISKSLWSQLTASISSGDRNGAYIWQSGADANTPFDELNPEQQAGLLEHIAEALINDATDGDDVFDENDFPTYTDADGNRQSVTPEQFAYAMAAWEQIQAGNGAT